MSTGYPMPRPGTAASPLVGRSQVQGATRRRWPRWLPAGWVRRAFWLLLLGLSWNSGLAQTISPLITTNLLDPYGVAVDANNNYYVTESASNCIVMFRPDTGVLTNFAGLPSQVPGYQDGPITAAQFYSPEGMVFVGATNRWGSSLLVADTGNNRIRLVSLADGTVSTLAGDGQPALTDSSNPLQASFYAPVGLAVDPGGNLYIADLGNGAVRKLDTANRVTTLATNLFHPSAVAYGGDGRLYVADTGNNCLRTIEPDGTVVLRAGSGRPDQWGLSDALDGRQALFDHPDSLFWVGGSVGLLVGDSGNHILRRVYYTTTSTPPGFAVETFAPSVGAGLGDVTGMAADQTTGILMVDAANNAVMRFSLSQGTLPPVNSPAIGYIVITNGGTLLIPVATATFNNDQIVGIAADPGTQTYYTIGPSDTANGVPDPNASAQTPPPYQDGNTNLPPSILNPIAPDVTVKAISVQADRLPSPIVTARFRFQVGNPAIIGVNPLAFTLDTVTLGAALWYTTDGSVPQENPTGTNGTAQLYRLGASLNVLNGTNDVPFQVRGFKDGYISSAVVSNTFYYTNAHVSQIGFTRSFRGGPGATIVIPVEYHLGVNDILQSVQFRVEVQPNGAASPLTAPLHILPFGSQDFIPLPDTPLPTYVEAYVTNGTTAGLAVAYLGASLNTNLLAQTVKQGVLSLLALTVPPTANPGDSYTVSLLAPSGTRDGSQAPVILDAMPPRSVAVTNIAYLVGDSSPGNGYNAGEFGDGVLANSDVNNAFYASAGVRVPFPFSDAFDVMDAFPLDRPGVAGGDGQIRFLDWQIILARALGLRQDNWLRSRGPGGVRIATSPGSSQLMQTPRSSSNAAATGSLWSRQVKITAGTVANAQQNAPVRVPLYVSLIPGASLAGLQLWPVISTNRAATSSDLAAIFQPNALAGVPSPGLSTPPGFSTNNVIYVWSLTGTNSFSPVLQGSNLLGWLEFLVPASAPAGTPYTVRFANADGAPDLNTQYDFETVPGTVWVHSPALAPAEEISDEWKLHFFGSLIDPAAQDGADPDQDGLSNLSEYLLGTNPLVPDWQAAVRVTQGLPVITWYGQSDHVYEVLRATSATLGAGTAGWQPLSPPLAGQDGFMAYTDTNQVQAARFYRVMILP